MEHPVLDINYFPYSKEMDPRKSGKACLQMICDFYGSATRKVKFLNDKIKGGKGITLLDVKLVADKIGFKTFCTAIDMEKLFNAPLPSIVHWYSVRFIVVYQIIGNKVYICDPTDNHGKIISKSTFLEGFTKEVAMNSKENPDQYKKANLDSTKKPGIVLLFEPSPLIFT